MATRYWRAVAKRAWRETLAVVPWSNRIKFVCALGALVAAVAVSWTQTHQIAAAALWGFAIVTGITFAAFLYELAIEWEPLV